MDISNRIYELMEIRGWTTYVLAEQAEMPQSTAASIVSGRIIPKIPTLEKICKAFGITLSEFFMDSEDNENNEKIQMASMIGTLSPKRKELTKELIKEFQKK